MDWNAAIERNREALKRVLASLLAMAGMGSGGQFIFFPVSGRFAKGEEQGPVDLAQAANARSHSGGQGARPQDAALAEKSKLSPAPTLPRHLHRAVLRLLRPAEAAARRLVIVAALAATPQARKTGDIVLPPPAPPRPRKPQLKSIAPVLRSLGIAVVISPADAARAAALARRPRAPRRKIALPLFDPLRMPRPGRSRYVPAHAAPRILSFDGARPHRLPPPPSPDDPIDATRVGLRLQALASALDDLPKHAKRFARWKAARDAAGAQNKGNRDRGLVRRISPLRPGRPPGQKPANSRRPAHEIHDVLSDLQYFAFMALERPDTS